MQCRNSPLAKSPPPNLPKIPGVTTPDTGAVENGQEQEKAPTKPGGEVLLKFSSVLPNIQLKVERSLSLRWTSRQKGDNDCDTAPPHTTGCLKIGQFS
ncbi:hypothetical protein LSH36_201g03045 [Paralvinella palmiformis]|uniref:Uncharacterized protein n=1 Tax=Paralvinella palmiformis TaxID=53620 RepID=A0AAD9JPN4_9ANNE|nr:hypothetical protein LSH36_201g03045 [Paralvinella palmiformis]